MATQNDVFQYLLGGGAGAAIASGATTTAAAAAPAKTGPAVVALSLADIEAQHVSSTSSNNTVVNNNVDDMFKLMAAGTAAPAAAPAPKTYRPVKYSYSQEEILELAESPLVQTPTDFVEKVSVAVLIPKLRTADAVAAAAAAAGAGASPR